MTWNTRETIEWRGRVLQRRPALSALWQGDQATVWERWAGIRYRAQLHPTPSCASEGYGDTPEEALEDARTLLFEAAKGFE